MSASSLLTGKHARSSVAASRRDHHAGHRVLFHAFFILLSLAFAVPLLLVISTSLTSEDSLTKYGYRLIPHEVSFAAYTYLLQNPQILIRAYAITIGVTLVGSVLSLTLMSLLAYPLSRRDYRFRKPLSFVVFFTLLFNGGLVPFYILVTQYLHLRNSLLALLPAYLVPAFYVLILRTYFANIPDALIDSAKVDGAGEWRIFFQIVLPLSKPALATIGLFSVLIYWNDFFQTLLFISDSHKFPVQYLLYSLLTSGTLGGGQFVGLNVPTRTVQMAMAVIAILPLLFAFIAVRRFFVRGITLGSLKG